MIACQYSDHAPAQRTENAALKTLENQSKTPALEDSFQVLARQKLALPSFRFSLSLIERVYF